jgi:hypothetical protein
MMIAVKGQMRRAEVPLSGTSIELFTPGKGLANTGGFGVLLDDWADGNNEVIMDNNMAIGISK